MIRSTILQRRTDARRRGSGDGASRPWPRMTEIQRRAFLARCFVFEHVSPLEDIPMPSHHDAWLRHQQSRWLPPDAARWLRPDAARFLPPGVDVAKAFPALARKYNPDQPRVLAGKRRWGRQSRSLSDHAARQHR